MIKRCISLLLITALLLSALCACGSSNASAADTYLSMAEDFVEQGNYDAAMDILQKGFSETKDERIAVMLAELSSSNVDAPANTDAPSVTEDTSTATEPLPRKTYTGIWAEEDIDWQNGGLLFDFYEEENGSVLIDVYYEAGVFSSSYSSLFSVRIADSDIQEGFAEVSFDEEMSGGSGTMTLQFFADSIICTVKDRNNIGQDNSNWGLCEGEYTLIEYADAWDKLSYTMDEYYELFPEERPTEQPTYDTSKASGLLAQAGLTEQEFKNICTYIGQTAHQDNAYVYAAGRGYYEQHPDENKYLDERINDWNNYVQYGKEPEFYEYELKKSSSLDEFLNRTIYGPKGAGLLGKQSEEIFERMQEYPADYVGQPFLLKNFRTTYVSNYTYTDDCYVIFDANISVIDYRDDVNYPNILQGTFYDMYVIFLGTNGSSTLVFGLISVEKDPTFGS